MNTRKPEPGDDVGIYAKQRKSVEGVADDLHGGEGKQQEWEAAAGLGLGHAVHDGTGHEDPGWQFIRI